MVKHVISRRSRALIPSVLAVVGVVAVAALIAVVAFRPSNDREIVDTAAPARTLVDPSEESGARIVGEPGDFVADDLEEAPPALALIDRDDRSPVPEERPDIDTAPESRDSATDDSSAELWDDSTAQPVTSTTVPITASGEVPVIDVEQAAQDPLAATSSTTSTPTSDGIATTTTTTTSAPTTTSSARQTPSRSTPTTTTPSTTTPPTTTTPPPTTPPTTTTQAPAPAPQGTPGAAGYIAPGAGTTIPVYDTAWQMLVRSTPAQAENYFAALKANGFTGTWSGIIHHAPATYNSNFAGGGQVGRLENGTVILNDAYIAHVRQILDAADRHGMKVGLVAAWQNLYLPGGGADAGVATSDAVRGTITANNAYAYGRQIADAFGDHPAVSMWVFGGDAGTNNTEANKAVWREMARGVRDGGSGLAITYHTPTSEFDQLNYAGEPWLDFISPETGHAQDAATTESELRTAKSAYGIPVWQGEPRYFNINFDWVNAAFRNPGVDEVRADAQAAKNAGVSGYVYGDAGRWTWCAGFGDSTPCDPNNVAASFGQGEAAVINVFRS